MALDHLDLQTISPDSFSSFGTVVDWTPDLEESGGLFHILVRSEAPTGWRLAMLKVRNRATQEMENHPKSEELFAPVEGRSVLLVSEAGAFDEDGVHAFLLDRPVSVGPGVWHGVITLSQYATILIAENLEVGSEYAKLSRPAAAALG
jgi:ureidoglycolate hydrolase